MDYTALKNTLLTYLKKISIPLWLMPFICAVGGYQCAKWLARATVITVPSVLGLDVGQAVTILANQGLNVRILKEKEDAFAKQGMVINQNPAPGQRTKKQQSIYLVITKLPPLPTIPQLVGSQTTGAAALAQSIGTKVKLYSQPSNLTSGTIIAQSPTVGHASDHVLLYTSGEEAKYRLMPSFIGQTYGDVAAFLKHYGIKAIAKYSPDELTSSLDETLIKNHSPRPGKVIDLAAISQMEFTL